MSMNMISSFSLYPVCCSYVLEERSEYAISLKRANDIRHLVPEMWALDDDDTTSSGRFKDNTLDQSLNLNQLAVRYEGEFGSWVIIIIIIKRSLFTINLINYTLYLPKGRQLKN